MTSSNPSTSMAGVVEKLPRLHNDNFGVRFEANKNFLKDKVDLLYFE